MTIYSILGQKLSICLLHSGDALFYGIDKEFWAKNPRVVTPAENPALNFFQGAKGHFKFNASIFHVPNLLAGVPISFTHKSGRKGVEPNFDQVLPCARKDTETALELLLC